MCIINKSTLYLPQYGIFLQLSSLYLQNGKTVKCFHGNITFLSVSFSSSTIVSFLPSQLEQSLPVKRKSSCQLLKCVCEQTLSAVVCTVPHLHERLVSCPHVMSL